MIGTIILAAGAGTRLGRGVKALLEIGGMTLLERQIKKCKGDVIVLTSQRTRHPIEEKLKELKIDHVQIVEMPMKQSLSHPEQYFPMGNGALYESVVRSVPYQKWKEKGITHIGVIFIDNPLADPNDSELKDGDLVVVAVKKRNPEERMGAVLQKENTLRIVEYSEIGLEERQKFMLGNVGTFMMEKELFEKAALLNLPWHVIEREGVKRGEKFLFDVFPLAERPKVLVRKREDVFAAIKEESDIAIAEEMLYNQRKQKEG